MNLDQDQGHWPSENTLILVYPFRMSLVDFCRISSDREKDGLQSNTWLCAIKLSCCVFQFRNGYFVTHASHKLNILICRNPQSWLKMKMDLITPNSLVAPSTYKIWSDSRNRKCYSRTMRPYSLILSLSQIILYSFSVPPLVLSLCSL